MLQAAHLALKIDPVNVGLCRFYAETLKTIAQKHVLRLDPDMNRSICKKCNVLLVPGVTAAVRIKSKREKHTVITCVECKTVQRFMLRKNHKLWAQQPEARFIKENKQPTKPGQEMTKAPKGSVHTQKPNTARVISCVVVFRVEEAGIPGENHLLMMTDHQKKTLKK